ncbi:hypothetical protein I6H52_08915 [Corynebacterium urealyticum]|uniref:DNA-binding protein n=1 Tax=Corynebacterium urealyticum (strain ATCC 43042 / DSM 7109) TaxID=504474 RepID=B1VFJ0_CORU7|nr:hypothetical protein [Corynebacterium urealyticum]QQC41981.1 hypothetical protein I6H51_09965 [Corynebacterium urealyticum]QQE50605.1 hypothetical protein I6H52_08915 [Corynebacterium urealyticum]CAQ04529.1 hypothetical protein cu0569 [Corynebacterium urealyticum DSM 7109]SNV95981.1 Uncharacterised protein [Corynebacterium urealyticum]
MDIKQWLSEAAKRPIYDQDIANVLGVTRKTANKRLNAQLDAGDLITICRALDVNPVIALVELDYITHAEVTNYLDSDGALVATAEPGYLALELARKLNPATHAPLIDELEARSATPHLHAVADFSPDEDALRNPHHDDPFDTP